MNSFSARIRDERRRSVLVETLLWLFVAGGAYLLTFGFDDPLPVYDFGPAYWPRAILFGMFISIGWIIYSEIIHQPPRSSVSQQDEETADEQSDDELDFKTKVRIVLIFVLPVFFTYLMHKLGFILTTPFFLFAYMALMGVRRLRSLIVLTLSIYAGLIIVFVKLIFTYLPPGAGVFNKINGTILGWLT